MLRAARSLILISLIEQPSCEWLHFDLSDLVADQLLKVQRLEF
jgi:hypothetical protein